MNIEETPLYRYYSLESFIYLITSRRLRFSKIKEWPDKFEGINYEYSEKMINNNTEVDTDNIFGLCWTQEIDIKECYLDNKIYQEANSKLQRDGSPALFGQYCGNIGVRVKTTLGKIIAKINTHIGSKANITLEHGPVSYFSYFNIRKNTVKSLFDKFSAYRYEAEYRFLLINSCPPEGTIEIDIGDPFDFFDEYLISPATKNNAWMAKALYNACIPVFQNMDVNSKNRKQFCRISQLYGNISEELGL